MLAKYSPQGQAAGTVSLKAACLIHCSSANVSLMLSISDAVLVISRLLYMLLPTRSAEYCHSAALTEPAYGF